jgi:ABC-type Fe3+-hydroxamate transport system substrate-binding protein
MLDRNEWSSLLIEEIKSALTQYAKRKAQSAIKAAYLIWNNPMMSVGSDTFIHQMLGVAGFENVFADKNRYPEITMEDLKEKAPQFVLLSSEPFPFRQKHVDELQEQLSSAPKESLRTKIILVDGEMFSWYGSRLLKAPEYFSELFQKLN